jgi:uncharacterized membrane protein YhaH (DUF805 family)
MPLGLTLSDLWRWKEPLPRKPFICWGVLLFLIKFPVDWTLARVAFDRPWSIEDYGIFGKSLERLLQTPQDPVYSLSLLAVSLPFLWCGVVLTLRRLRSAALPAGLVLLFFIPVLKLLFFVVLAAMPETRDSPGPAKLENIPGLFGRFIPQSPFPRALVAIVFTLAYAFCLTWIGTKYIRSYGWTLFVGLPFWMGLSSALIYGYHKPQRLRVSVGMALLTIVSAGVAFLVTAFEGLICLLMAAPIALIMAAIGGVIANRVQASRFWPYQSATVVTGLLLLLMPAALKIEGRTRTASPILKVNSRLLINAPPRQVWRNVVSFSELPKPTEWLFKTGIAYPMRAEIYGHGAGAVRHCTFTTGPFVEPIEVWEEPRLLKFAVTANPHPMQEWTPYSSIRPPHLDGFLVSRAGQFRLTPLA